MNKKIKNFLRRVILEEVEELFSPPAETESKPRLSQDSLDDQVDAFILKYEKDSVKEDGEPDSISESLANLSLAALLSEQDDEEEDVDLGPPIEDFDDAPPDVSAGADDPAADKPEEAPKTPPAGSENMSADVEAIVDIPKPPLDVDAFSKRVARLAMNYNTLLDVRVTIVNRALNFLAQHYDQEHANEMREILDSEYDFDLTGSDNEPGDHYAVGAFAGGTGGLGGGGA